MDGPYEYRKPFLFFSQKNSHKILHLLEINHPLLFLNKIPIFRELCMSVLVGRLLSHDNDGQTDGLSQFLEAKGILYRDGGVVV